MCTCHVARTSLGHTEQTIVNITIKLSWHHTLCVHDCTLKNIPPYQLPTLSHSSAQFLVIVTVPVLLQLSVVCLLMNLVTNVAWCIYVLL